MSDNIRLLRCKCGDQHLLDCNGCAICQGCYNELLAAKNDLVKENFDLLAANAELHKKLNAMSTYVVVLEALSQFDDRKAPEEGG